MSHHENPIFHPGQVNDKLSWSVCKFNMEILELSDGLSSKASMYKSTSCCVFFWSEHIWKDKQRPFLKEMGIHKWFSKCFNRINVEKKLSNRFKRLHFILNVSNYTICYKLYGHPNISPICGVIFLLWNIKEDIMKNVQCFCCHSENQYGPNYVLEYKNVFI